MPQTIYLLNGPNLNLLGKRQPEIYGQETLADVEDLCRSVLPDSGFELRAFQSNAEHQLIEWIHEARDEASGLVINPGAFTHTSIAILDALNACDFPVVEVHISNIHRRESFRHISYVSFRADGVIAGCGVQGYEFAMHRLVALITGNTNPS